MTAPASDYLLEHLPSELRALVEMAGAISAQHGIRSYLVGGVVRDLLLGRPSQDIDIMTEGDAAFLAESIALRCGGSLTLHRTFGTATCVAGAYRLDFSTCRSESYTHPGALPRVRPGTVTEDLFRRDFTINTLAISLDPGRKGQLLDLYGGRADLERKLIRVLHDGSFRDDATRIMRAIRYSRRLGFSLERKTAALLRRDIDMLDTISSERVRREVLLWLGEACPAAIIRTAARLGILRKLEPSLEWDIKLKSAFNSETRSLEAGTGTQRRFCLLVHGLQEDGLYALVQRLNLAGTRYDLLAHQSLAVKNLLPALGKRPLKRSDLYFMLKDFDSLAVEVNLLFPNHPAVRSSLRLYLDKLRGTKVLLKGGDLTALGVKPGPQVGEILRHLHTARLDGLVKTRAGEERLARRLAGF